MRTRLVVLAAVAALSWGRPGFGQAPEASLALPQMAACLSAKHPLQPEKWRATFLMAPFTGAQLVLADIEHDGTLGATRAGLYGVKHGSADLLVLGRHTYLLGADGGRPTQCRDLGDTGWRPLPRDWLAGAAQCVGSAPVAETAVDWWKLPAGRAGLANWMWFKSSDQSPFRLMLVRPDDALGPLGWFALSYQVRFAPLRESGLADVVALCRAAPAPARHDGREAARQAIVAMDRSPLPADSRIKQLMPAIDGTCDATALPQWPDSFSATAFMTSLSFRQTTFATEVLYSWARKAQRTRLFSAPAAPTRAEDALLIGPTGYGITHFRNGRSTCTGPQPGALRPDWPAAGSCSCEARIDGTTALTPYGPTQIMRCPVTAPRVFWSWYTRDGRPMVFMETASGDEKGALLTLVDYYSWRPGLEGPDTAFAKPAQCAATPGVAGPGSASDPYPCFSCHLGGASSH